MHIVLNIFLHNLGTWVSGPKLMGVWAREVCKTLGPLFISATVEANNFEFGTTWAWGVAYQERTFWTKTGGCLG